MPNDAIFEDYEYALLKEDMMRVTMLCLEWPSSKHSGGVARYAYRMASGLCKLVDLTIVTIEGGLDLPGARIVQIRKPRSRFDRYYWLPFVARAAVLRQGPDIIHSFGDDWPFVRRTVPVIRSFFGSSWSEAKSSSGIRRLNHAILALTEKFSQLRSTVRIAIAPETMDIFNCHRLMPPVTEVEVHDRRPSASPSAVFIGSFGGRKRGQVAERAVQEVSKKLGRDITLTVIGPNSDRQSWHSDTRHISGASDREVAQIISQSWVLLSPSLYEGFGIPVFEALSLGVAAIASDNPGSNYFESLCKERGAFALAKSDLEFVAILEQRILDGPSLARVDFDGGQKAVHRMLELASISRLVDEVYAPLVQVGRDRS